MISKKLSKLYTKSTVFKDKEILKKGHHPHSLDEVLHRDDVIDIYINLLKDVLENKVPDNIFVYGAFGTGKTMLTRLITSEIAAAANQAGYKVIVVYIYCDSTHAPSPLMREINQTIIENIPNYKNKNVGISLAKNFEYFCELVNLATTPIILIFDEIDKLDDPDIINQYSRIKECQFTSSNVCIIGITNDTNFYNNLDGRTKSIIGQNELFIPPYDALQMADILTVRAQLAFNEGCCEDIAIKICAAFGAQENGDARTSMDLLKLAGEIADIMEEPVVTEACVRMAKGRIEVNRQLEVIKSLPTQTQAVLFACVYLYDVRGVDVETSEVYLKYLRICAIIDLDPVTQRRVNDYITELHDLGILTVNKISRGRKRGVVNHIKPNADVFLIEQAILQDYRFEELQKKISLSRMSGFKL